METQKIPDIVERLRQSFDLDNIDPMVALTVYMDEREEAAREIERLRALIKTPSDS